MIKFELLIEASTERKYEISDMKKSSGIAVKRRITVNFEDWR